MAVRPSYGEPVRFGLRSILDDHIELLGFIAIYG